MRKRVYEIIETSKNGDKLSAAYDFLMMICIIASLVPMVFKEVTPILHVIDIVTVTVFIVDYLLRFMTADYKYGQRSIEAFVKYPFSFMALVDLISILPSLTLLNASFKLFRIFRMMKVMRMMRALRAFRVFKAARYSRSMEIISEVFKNSKEALGAVGTLAIVYIIISAMVVFNAEPDTFDTFFDAFYWACVSLTTVGYGDIYPVTTIGKIITMISSLFGIAIVALPSGIVTAGYLDAIKGDVDRKHHNE